MILLVGPLLGIVAGLLSGGRLSALGDHRIRGADLFIGLFAVQLLGTALPWGLSEAVMLYGFWSIPVLGCLAVALWNFREPGFALIALGFAANLFVVTANAGMPVLSLNAELIGGTAQLVDQAVAGSWLHVSAHPDTVLLWLSDVIPVPGPGAIRGMVSVGDVFLSMGLGLYILRSMHVGDSK
ncbi:MAG: DUF5317 domain-containing protein [Actinobacteria bacterium]|nr:DUF5317 domain-containing protein [Actinomycetota bacterium]